MCSFLFSTKSFGQHSIESINKLLKLRGPDYTSHVEINNYSFLHNLLSITGPVSPQPFTDKDIAVLYNGEIYNYKQFGNYKSDGQCLIDLYKEHGKSFVKLLDGEFAICLIDFAQQKLIISTDIFKTKPIFFGFDDGQFGCSTYSTPLQQLGYKQIKKATPNTLYEFDLTNFKCLSQEKIYEFSLNQHKLDYEDWVESFNQSIKKRTIDLNKNLFIGLSSGYDSGLIYLKLIEQNKPFTCLSLFGTENSDIIHERLSMYPWDTSNIIKLEKNQTDFNFSKLQVKSKTEPFLYPIQSDDGYKESNMWLVNDQGSINFATLCRHAKKQKCKVVLSGTGADEIISDYGFKGKKFFPHSNFGGVFPKDLSKIFPWSSFYGSTLESYIAKEEYVGGSFGIEVRYPFLDKNVIQEYLWLSQDLKNSSYKAPLEYIFSQTNFPYEKENKRGF